jgi:hypothetical protein
LIKRVPCALGHLSAYRWTDGLRVAAVSR